MHLSKVPGVSYLGFSHIQIVCSAVTHETFTRAVLKIFYDAVFITSCVRESLVLFSPCESVCVCHRKHFPGVSVCLSVDRLCHHDRVTTVQDVPNFTGV